MSPSWISQPANIQDKESNIAVSGSRSCLTQRTKRFWIILAAFLLVIAIGVGVGLGVGLTRPSSDSDSASSTPSPLPTPNTNNTNSTTGNFWKPIAGESWQMVLEYALNDTSPNVSVYDIDLFTNPASTIQNLHVQGRKVICYFSAGSYEDFRPDSREFTKTDYGNPLEGWDGEWWLDTTSSNVRRIMKERLSLAKSKGCDGVDPDNIDGYDPQNHTGLNLTEANGVDYLAFLATEAHALNMSIGLKNGGDIVNQTVEFLQWEVNEECVHYKECDLFRPYIDAGKPVFHIEYPPSYPRISESTKNAICNDNSARGFSTLLKDHDAGNFFDPC